MDDKGFAFSPLAYLMIIPVMVLAISYGNIVDEANFIGSMITGGDVTYSSATTIFSTMQKGAGDAGRNAAYNASRKVIDNTTFFTSGTSKNYIRDNVIAALNIHIINTTLEVEHQTGRQIYINNISIDNYNAKPFNSSNVNITQTDPFGFYVNVKGGIPIKIVQPDNDQVYQLNTPDMSTYVTIEGLEDPYIWIYTKFRTSNVIYKYKYATVIGTPPVYDYYFDTNVDTNDNRLYYLWDCLNGTDNPSTITPRPNYFPDPNGLSFFDRLEGKNTSTEPNNVKMSTFILGDPLMENHGRADISRIDHEYIAGSGVVGTDITIGSAEMTDPLGSIFYLSNTYKNFFKLKSNY